MSLSIYLTATIPSTVFDTNITHNLGKMAAEADVYNVMWRPEEHGIEKASQLIEPLEKGLADLRSRPQYFVKFNPENGWGTYEGLVATVEAYLQACRDYPDAIVTANR